MQKMNHCISEFSNRRGPADFQQW